MIYNYLGCMSGRGVGNIHFIGGIMDKYVYNDIQKKNVKMPSRCEYQMLVCSNRTTIADILLS